VNKLSLLVFSIILIPAGSQIVFADTMVIGQGSSMTVKDGSNMQIDSDDSPNTLTNKGDLTIEDGGKVVISKEGNFFNDCNANTSLDGNNAMQIGTPGALLSSLTNHGSIFGPGQINFVANTIEVKNSDILAVILNPAAAIISIASICSTDGGTVVGGVFIPIDTSSLVIVGAQSSMMWLLPAGVIVGTSIVLIKTTRREKVNE